MIKKNKVAVQLSGYIRTFHDCFDSWSNILTDKYEYDFFVHTYENYGYSKGFCFNDISDDELVDIDLLKSKINIKKIVVEKNVDNSGRVIPSGHSDNRVKLMFRKIFLCNQIYNNYLIETGDKYDFVIRLRPDLFFNEKVDLYKPDGNVIIFNKYSWGKESIPNTLNDQIAICGGDTINFYSNLFNMNILNNKQPESVLFEYMSNSLIKIEFLDMKFEIKRR